MRPDHRAIVGVSRTPKGKPSLALITGCCFDSLSETSLRKPWCVSSGAASSRGGVPPAEPSLKHSSAAPLILPVPLGRRVDSTAGVRARVNVSETRELPASGRVVGSSRRGRGPPGQRVPGVGRSQMPRAPPLEVPPTPPPPSAPRPRSLTPARLPGTLQGCGQRRRCASLGGREDRTARQGPRHLGAPSWFWQNFENTTTAIT